MKQRLTEAAERCFRAPTSGKWWGYCNITPEREDFDYLQSWVDYDYDRCTVNANGPASVWFLLLCTEAAE